MMASVGRRLRLGRRPTATLPRDVAFISEAIKARGITVIDVIQALAKRGFARRRENLLNVVKLRVSGDYLQTSAVVRDGKVISAVNDPNDYPGPGTGYRLERGAPRESWRTSATCSTATRCCAAKPAMPRPRRA